MNTEQTAQQLELAAQILRTGHPWEYNHDKDFWQKASGTSVLLAISEGWPIRPVLATPPDNRPLHNPDNLTAEQVGVGYRLLCAEDGVPSGKVDTWMFGGWCSAYVVDKKHLHECDKTYRLPLSVPWPEAKPDPYAELKKAHAEGKVIEVFVKDDEYGPDRWSKKESDGWPLPPDHYRIKPTPTFQLPPPPPGMQWHRTDGWQEGDLPQGMRPLVLGEARIDEDQLWDGKWFDVQTGDLSNNTRAIHSKSRTRRPLTFTHAGKTWTWHRPGDPMPCDGEARIEIISLLGKTTSDDGTLPLYPRAARSNIWEQTLGWRYADETKTVPLGPEDVPPGSVFRWPEWPKFHWKAIRELDLENVYFCAGIGDTHGSTTASYELLKSNKAEINRSIPLTGKWNPDAWEPCSKQIDA